MLLLAIDGCKRPSCQPAGFDCSMTVAGYVDQVMTREIVGWAADTDASNGSVIVEVIAEGRVIASGSAYLYREDLRAAGIGDGRHGFRIAIPDVPDGVPVSCRSRGSDAELPRSQPGLDATQRFEGRFHHTLRFGLPSPAYGLKEGPMPKGAEAIVERLVRSFRAAIERDTGKLGKLWGPVVDDLHGELYALMQEENVDKICDYLNNASARGISKGFFHGRDLHPKALAPWHLDHLVSLAEALGCITVQCPEKGSWTGNFEYKPDDLVGLIEASLGIDISPRAGVNSYFGVVTSRGYLNFRIIDAIYSAYRIKELVCDKSNAAICEIGGGAGLAAYYATKLG